MISRKKAVDEPVQEQPVSTATSELLPNETAKDEDEFKVKLSIKIGDRLVESDLDDALSIPTIDKLNPATISNMLAGLPALHGRWNFLYNEAAFEYDIMKTKVEVWTAKKSQEYRKSLSKDPESPRVTDKMIDEMIKTDPEYKKYNDDLAMSKRNMKHVLAQANGFGEKGDRLTSIASMMKWEAEAIGASRKMKGDKEFSHIKNQEDFEGSADPKVNGGWPT